MNIYSTTGAVIVIVALFMYSIAIFTERKTRKASNKVLQFLTIGLILDITATIFMIIGSSNSAFSLHGVLGYSSLAAMLAETLLMWRFRIKNNAVAQVPLNLHKYSLAAYLYWVIAFITGLMLVVMH